MTYEIEKDVPVPSPATGSGLKYPFVQMAVGDSFFVPGKTSRVFGGIAGSYAKRLGIKVTMRTMDGGVRVWRTA